MKGTFQGGDVLIIEDWTIENLHKGDVIAYRDIRGGRENNQVVHRIIRISQGCLVTRGDNNRRPDIHPVSTEKLIGKVIAFKRKGKVYRVIGGFLGLIKSRIGYFFRRYCYLFYQELRKLLSVKKINNMVCKFWKPSIRKIKYPTSEGPLIKYIFRNRTIARWWPEQNRWECKKPYDLILKPENPYS